MSLIDFAFYYGVFCGCCFSYLFSEFWRWIKTKFLLKQTIKQK